jgi:hypothetical protein
MHRPKGARKFESVQLETPSEIAVGVSWFPGESELLTRIVIEFMTGWAMAERGWEISFHEQSISVDSFNCRSIRLAENWITLAEAKTEELWHKIRT